MDYQEQITEINSKLRKKATGLRGGDIAIKSGVKPSNVSTWLKGLDCGLGQLSKLARSLGMKITIKLEQDWSSGEREGLSDE